MRGSQVKRKISHCHKSIRKVARELAAASYEILMGNDFVYKEWKRQHPDIADNPKRLLLMYVNKKWGLYIEAARATLVGVLQQPIDDKIKDEIMEILALDSTLIRGRVKPMELAGIVNNKQ